MFLQFPNLESLQLALTAGAVPETVRNAPAEVAVGDDGSVHIRPDRRIGRAVLAELARWGGALAESNGAPPARAVNCWPEIFPLRREARNRAIDEKTPVLFELPDEQRLAEVVGEILRLGNDRQSYRCIELDNQPRVLLRVIGPPYYSLLRAFDGNRDESAIRAYTERAPHVWVEAGFDHPLAGSLHLPPGRLLLLSAPHDWRYIPEAPFRDVYEILNFQLPDHEVPVEDRPLEHSLTVPLRLVRGGTADAAELWVLRGDSVSQLEEFVQGAAEPLLERFSFAVGRNDGQRTVVVRVRPGRQAAPVLVLDALACRSYLKFPNLFVPVGLRLHPPLRRDAVKRLLVSDDSGVVWLEPAENGRFRTLSLPDTAFRPLSDWVEYVLDEEPAALEAWVQSARFDFEPFVCRDEEPRRPRPAAVPKSADRPKSEPKPGKPQKTRDKPEPGLIDRLVQKLQRKPDPRDRPVTARPSERRVLEERLRALERQFLDLDAPADAEERRNLWRDMARVNALLKYHADAALCRLQALWDETAPELDAVKEWYRAEWAAAVSASGRRPAAQPVFSAHDLDELLTVSHPSPSHLQALAAYLAWTVRARKPAPHVLQRLGLLWQLLERNESHLSVRGAWLAAGALFELSEGDVLALARTRDRLLERLYHHGLSPERDLPSFLRTSGQHSSDRFRAIRDQVAKLRETVLAWSRANRSVSASWTEQYIDLIFAFGLARLGELERARALAEQAGLELGTLDDVHHWLSQAYLYRIRQVLDGKPPQGPLPAELLAGLEGMDRLDRYKVDRLRDCSRILEPHERLDPYRRWHRKYADSLARELDDLADVLDAGELARRIADLRGRPLKAGQRVQVICRALELGPRLGEAASAEPLDEVLPLLQVSTDVLERARLLEKALFLAGHFDQAEYVQLFVEKLHELLAAEQRVDAATLQALGTLLFESFRGMRRMGLRDSIARLLEQVDALVSSLGLPRDAKERIGDPAMVCETARIQLQIAAGWLYFNQEERAAVILDRCRDLLFRDDLMPTFRTQIARAYVGAVAHGRAEEAIPRLYQLFKHLRGISDSYTSNSHYSRSQLEVVETVVLAMVSDDFTLDKAGRRWLDDDEFLIRRRIHRDMRRAMDADR